MMTHTGAVHKKRIKLLIAFVFAMVMLLNFRIAPSYALNTGLDETKQVAYEGAAPFENKSISAIVGQIVGAALSLIAVLFMVLLIYGGFIWMVARGNENEVTKAKDLITAAIIGLVIVLSAYAITKFIGMSLFEGQTF